MRDKAHTQWRRYPEHLRADITQTYGTKRFPDQPGTHVVGSLGKSLGTTAHQAILDHESTSKSQDKRQYGNGNRPSDAVRCDADRNAGCRAGGNVDCIETYAESGDQAQAAAGRNTFGIECLQQQYQCIVVFQGFTRHAPFNTGYISEFNLGVVAQRLQVEHRKHRLVGVSLEGPGQGHTERTGAVHRLPGALARPQRRRRSPIPWLSVCW